MPANTTTNPLFDPNNSGAGGAMLGISGITLDESFDDRGSSPEYDLGIFKGSAHENNAPTNAPTGSKLAKQDTVWDRPGVSISGHAFSTSMACRVDLANFIFVGITLPLLHAA